MKKAEKILYILVAIPVSLALLGFIGTAIYKPKEKSE
jgi:hypothetical protein